MRSIQTHQTCSLSAVKPLEGLRRYRARCLEATRAALGEGAARRMRSPATGGVLHPAGDVEGVPYARCPATGSLFLAQLPAPSRWARLLADVNQYRHAPEGFHAGLAQSRTDHVYAPKLEWIEDALRLQGIRRPSLLEATTGPSAFTALLEESASFSGVVTVDESELAQGRCADARPPVEAAVLLESLDRSHDPEALVRGVLDRLAPGGLVFVTALVCSGFDVEVLGLKNLYLYPPDRANCFSLGGLSGLLRRAGLTLLEVSTPGVLDVEIVRAHAQQDPSLALSLFERRLLAAGPETHEAFQAFLQQQGLSSFARLVTRKEP